MPTETPPDHSLHLPSLVIKNFRGIDELTIPRLGRVTLLAGKNGVGKTTVLDAVRVWAGRGQFQVLEDVLFQRGDAFVPTGQKGGQSIVSDWLALFTDRWNSSEIAISIGPLAEADTLRISWEPNVKLQSDRPAMLEPDEFVSAGRPAFIVWLGDSKIYSRFGDHTAPSPPVIPCKVQGPNGPSDAVVEQYWHDLALSHYEDRAVESLNLVADAHVERVAAVQPVTGSENPFQRRLMAKLSGRDYPVPLRTLGDGAMRAYAIALALAKSTNGFLLIDEAENGIHHSIQSKFWNMVLQTAQRNNVQVLATTHSWDCVRGFAQAASDLEDVEGMLVRLERVPIGLRAITYDESRLEIAARSNIEVR